MMFNLHLQRKLMHPGSVKGVRSISPLCKGAGDRGGVKIYRLHITRMWQNVYFTHLGYTLMCLKFWQINPLTPTVAIWVSIGYGYKASCARPGQAVICKNECQKLPQKVLLWPKVCLPILVLWTRWPTVPVFPGQSRFGILCPGIPNIMDLLQGEQPEIWA